MSAKIDEATNDADKYASMVLHYSHNAQRYLNEKDYHKSSEMMWGALSCSLKMAAAKKGQSIKSHRDLGIFARKLSKLENDPEIFASFSRASTLHKNFYESDLDKISVLSLIEDVRKTVGLLMQKMGYRAP